MPKYQYRVCWKRDGFKAKTKRYETLRGAQRFVTLLGPEPWKAIDRDPDDYWINDPEYCNSPETVREHMTAERKDMPALEYVRIQRREIGDWWTESEQLAGKENK